MAKAYVLTSEWDYEGATILGVFGTPEKAMEQPVKGFGDDVRLPPWESARDLGTGGKGWYRKDPTTTVRKWEIREYEMDELNG